MSDRALAVVEQLWEVLSTDDIVAALASDEKDRLLRATLARVAEPEFEVRILPPENLGGLAFEDRGPDGFRRVWEEWTGPFASFRVELEKRLESSNDVIDLVRIAGMTTTGGVEVEQAGAAVWTVRDGKLARAAFFFDPDDALKAAGIDPDRR